MAATGVVRPLLDKMRQTQDRLAAPEDAARRAPLYASRQALILLQALNQEHNKTIVMVTHDAQAAEYAKHTMFMDKGTLAVDTAA